ncbi:hypothetical protein [Parasphingorhabdus sp.]|uniref:hypothetical protein n=1 Tax=Parasphingorhabdus sp. TaxID=2709688 RepID=UPI003265A4D2
MKYSVGVSTAFLMVGFSAPANAVVLQYIAKGIGMSEQSQNLASVGDSAMTAIAGKSAAVRGATGAINQLLVESDELICSSWTIQMRVHIRNMQLEEYQLRGNDKLKMQKAIVALNQFSAKLQEECTRLKINKPDAIVRTGFGVTREELEASTRAYQLQRDIACRQRLNQQYSAVRQASKEQRVAWAELDRAKQKLARARMLVNRNAQAIKKLRKDRISAENSLSTAIAFSKPRYEQAYKIRHSEPTEGVKKRNNIKAAELLESSWDTRITGLSSRYRADRKRELAGEELIRTDQIKYNDQLQVLKAKNLAFSQKNQTWIQGKSDLESRLLACQKKPWEGTWTANAGAATMKIVLTQESGRVTGTFTDPTGMGSITDGRISGSTLRAKWSNPHTRKNSGTFIWKLSENRQKFSGTWKGQEDSSGTWNGTFVPDA